MAFVPRMIDQWLVLAVLALLLGILAGRAAVHLLLKSPWIAVRQEKHDVDVTRRGRPLRMERKS